MSAEREVWVMGGVSETRREVVAALRAAGRSVSERAPLGRSLVDWVTAGWPLLVSVVVPDDLPRVGAHTRHPDVGGVRPPVLAILAGSTDVGPLVAGGASDVMRWPQDADMLLHRVALLEARSGREALAREQIVGRQAGALYVFHLPTRRVTWVSPDAEQSIGLEAARLLNASERVLASMLHPDDVSYLHHRIAEMAHLADGEPILSEYRFRAGSGWRWIRLHGVVLDRLADGSPCHIIGVARDASDSRGPEEALRTILQGTAAVGEAFFRSLARELARFLGARHVVVGEIIRAEGEMLRSVAFWGNGSFQAPVEFSIPGSAAESVGFGEPVHFVSGVQEQFPSDLTLERLGVEGVLGVPIFDSARRPSGMILVWHDGRLEVDPTARTLVDALAVRAGAELERARWDAALRTEEERLRLATAAAGIGVWDWDIVTDELVWKGEADTIFGDPRIAASRSPGAFWDHVHPEDYRRGRAAFQRAIDGDDRVQVEVRFVRGDGVVRWISVRGELFRDAAGAPIRMTGTAADITTRRAADDRIRASEERLKLALGGARAGMWDWDFTRGTIYYSPEWEGMLGYAPGTLAAEVSTWKQLVHPDDRELVARELVRHLKGHTEVYETEHRLRHLDGSWVWVLDRGKVVERSAEGRAVRMTGIQTDISERKQLETQLLLADRMTTVGTLASGIAHEVNNPLAYVVGNLEYLLTLVDVGSAPVNPRTRRALTDAIEGAERVRAIIADLKTFSTAEGEASRSLDVHQVIDAALRIAQNELRHQARLEKIFQARRPVLGAAGKLGQVFVNLLSNALQAMPPARSSDQNLIRVVTADLDADHVIVDVEDNGVGMAPDVMRRVFDPFFTTHPVGAATGLGLTAAHNVVTAMGGRLEVESETGRGSRFRVVLPVAPAIEAPAVAWAEVPAEPPSGRVLVVDDEPMVANVIEAMLGATHTVVKVDSAAAALDRIRAGEAFDVVLCDLMMPSMTGMAFYDELRAVRPALAAHTGFVTGGAFTRAASDFVTAMRDRCIEKPFDGMTLRRFVGWLSGPRD